MAGGAPKAHMVGVIMPGGAWAFVWMLVVDSLTTLLDEQRTESWKAAPGSGIEGEYRLVPGRVLAMLKRAVELGGPATIDAEAQQLSDMSATLLKVMKYELTAADRAWVDRAVKRFGR